jgi:hypothetical protein
MTKFLHDDVLDGALNIIKNNANLMVACSQAPATRTEAVTTYALADVAMVSGDFTVVNGDTNGRKVTTAAKASVPIDATGNATHYALVDATRLLLVSECTPQQLTSGGTVDFPAWKWETSDPV